MPFRTTKRFDLPDDYLTEVGRVAIEWSHLEFVVEEVIWTLLRLPWGSDEARAVTAHIPFRVRLDIISSLLRPKEVPPQGLQEWNELLKEINAQHEWRNLVVHHEWRSGSPTKQMIYRRSARTKGVSTTPYEAPLDAVKETAADIVSVRARITTWLGQLW